MRIALTGATGLLSLRPMDSFLRADRQVRAWVRSSCSFPREFVALQGNLENQDTFPPLVRGVDALAHSAWRAYVHELARREGWPVLAMALDSLYGTRRRRILPGYLEAMARKSYHREEIRCLFNPGGYVHRRDIAAAVNLLLAQPAGTVEGQTFGCGDLWLDPYNLADLLDEIVGTLPEGQVSIPPCRVDCSGLRRLGWSPGGQPLLRAELERWILATGQRRRPGDPRGPEPKPVQPSGGPTPP